MKHLTLLLLFLLPFGCVLWSQNASQPGVPAFLIFHMGANSLDSNDTHVAHLIGCDTILKVEDLAWNTPGQIRDRFPYGPQGNSGKFISKYYIASPPLYNESPKNPEALYNIGLVTPDEFWLEGEHPAQQVYMDYSVLELMKIEYFPFTYDATFSKDKHILVPFKVECANYPWNAHSGIPNALGASGIGYFTSAPGDTNKLFLPYYETPLEIEGRNTLYVTNYLDCQITLLNDVLSDHDLKFIVNGVNMGSSINLQDYAGTAVQIQLTRQSKSVLPCGCQPPAN